MFERARKARETLVKAARSRHPRPDAAHPYPLADRGDPRPGRAGLPDAGIVTNRRWRSRRGSPTPTPATSAIQSELARAYLRPRRPPHCTTGNPSEALPWHDKALAIQRKMVEAKLSHSGPPCRRPQAPRNRRSRSAAGPPRRSRPSARRSPFSKGWPTRDLATSTTSPASNRSSTVSLPMPAPVSRLPTDRPRRTRRWSDCRRAVTAGWTSGRPHADRHRPRPDPLATRLPAPDDGPGGRSIRSLALTESGTLSARKGAAAASRAPEAPRRSMSTISRGSTPAAGIA